jgi:hypothetical protein
MTDIVFSNKVNGPATHALIIGVGHYPHLPGGGKKRIANPDGMGQLTSPPESARQVARWLIEKYVSPTRPLGSVALLTSEKAPSKFVFQAQGKTKSKTPELATMPAVEQAILEWHARCNTNPDHLLLFYFCGHGIAAGTELALLMSDFGAKAKKPLDGALDFRRFHASMDECAARHQCYFIDACRVGSELLKRNEGYAGNPVIQWTGAGANPNGQLRCGPIFYSTLANAAAYAKAGKVSIFTQALLDSLGGAGSTDSTGPWEVKTMRLTEALDYLMLQASRALKMPQAQIPSLGGTFAQFTLNTLASPAVPVFVQVEPPEALALASLRCEGEAMKKTRPPKPEPWQLSVTAGKYSFFADFKSQKFKASPFIDEIVRPPFWGKPLKVQP